MKIGVIQASSQINKNNQLYEYVRQYAIDHEVFNFGCFADEDISYSYIEISILVGLLLNSGSIDFIVTGCSSGQGMMPKTLYLRNKPPSFRKFFCFMIDFGHLT